MSRSTSTSEMVQAAAGKANMSSSESESFSSYWFGSHTTFLFLHAVLLFVTIYAELETLSKKVAELPCCFNEKVNEIFKWLISSEKDGETCYTKYLIINYVLMLAVIFVTKEEKKPSDSEKEAVVPPATPAIPVVADVKTTKGGDAPLHNNDASMSLNERISKNFPTISSVIFPFSCLIAYMALIYSMIKGLYDKAIDMQFDTVEYPDFLADDPYKRVWIEGPAYGTVIYLGGVYFGKKIMKDRKAFNITSFVFLYNLYQCLMNFTCVVTVIYILFTNPLFKGVDLGGGFQLPRIWGNKPGGDGSQRSLDGFWLAMVVWVHYNNKYLELLDTLWMVLKKKNEQISFLHVYHHVLLIWAWWYCCTIGLGGDCYFGASINSFIHIIMYAYYTGALLKYDLKVIKKNITNCQMLQFAICLGHSIYVVKVRNVRVELPLAQGFVMVNMLYLFAEFSRVAYAEKKAAIERSKSQQILAQQQIPAATTSTLISPVSSSKKSKSNSSAASDRSPANANAN